MEMGPPYTQNTAYLNQERKRFLVELSHCLAKEPSSDHDEEFIKELQALATKKNLDADFMIKQITQPQTVKFKNIYYIPLRYNYSKLFFCACVCVDGVFCFFF